MIAPIYRGSVKDILGPATGADGCAAVLFDYTDAFSVFDWGRMPDTLPHKGEALAILAAHWFERLEDASTWREFSRAPEALALRKGNRFGSAFNELGEKLQSEGLRTHYLGVLTGARPSRPEEVRAQKLGELTAPAKRLLVRQVASVRPVVTTVLGRGVPDYGPTRNAPSPRLIPLEVVFRFSLPPGSSLLERAARDPEYLAQRGFGHLRAEAGARWDFPVLELFTKLESTDRPVGLGEAMAISGLSAVQLQEVLLRTAWVAAWLRADCSRAGLELADGKLEWAWDQDQGLVLVDAVGPDELRILKGGVQLSKEFLRNFYRSSDWYAKVEAAKKEAQNKGAAEWKRLVGQEPPALPQAKRELAARLYMALTNRLTGRDWFPDAGELEPIVDEVSRA